MATKKRFKEAELIDQNETQAQAVPATDAEVAQATPVGADTAEPSMEDEAVLPEGTEGEGVGAEAQVNPETISVEVQIPTDQLASAVAQATGDLEVANLSPDVQAAQEGELVADGSSEGEDVPVEGAVDDSAMGDQGAAPDQFGQQLESQECGKDDKLTEESNPDYTSSEKVANKRDGQIEGMIDHAISVEDETLREGVEEDAAPRNAAGAGDYDDELEGLPPGMDGEIEGDIDPALIDVDGEGDIPGLVGDDDFAIDGDDPAVQDFLSKIDGYLADEDAQPAQVADALRASADFFDAIAPEEEDDDLLDVEDGEEGEDDEEIPLDLDAIETTNFKRKTGDEVLDEFDDIPEDYDESLVRVPCKFPKKKFGEKKSPRNLPLVKESKKIKEAFEDDYEDEDWDAYEEFDILISEWGEEKTLKALLRFLTECDPDIVTEFIGAVKSGYIDAHLLESKKSKKLTEDVDYSAVKFPAGSSEDDGENMVEAYEKTQASRRKAIKNFRESVIKNNENNSISRNSRFDEALRSSVRTNSRPSSNSSPNSWANNRFVERMEEREELDFKALIRDGFLG